MRRAELPSATRAAERGLRYATVAVFAAGVRRRDPGAVVNAVFSFAAMLLPDVVERRYGVEFRPWQRVYAGAAIFAHAVGMLGPYDETWWWDHLTHTLSATLLGGVVHVVSRRRGRPARPRVLAAVAGAGVGWELLEYAVHRASARLGIEPMLKLYSLHDSVGDIVFDLVGALLVLLFGDRLLRNFVRGGE